jgi:hypothetical protein
MNKPNELAEIENGVSAQALITTSEEADQLLQSHHPYQAIIFACDGTYDIAKIIRIVSKHQTTLRSLTLDRGPGPSISQTSTIPLSQTIELGKAIAACQQLRSLQIKRFYGAFTDNIKYLIVGIVNLTNLERLNFKETYLFRQLSFLMNGLSSLSFLRTLNLDRCAFVSHHDFYILGLTILRPNIRLTELDLGCSAIILVGCFELLQAFGSTRNQQLNLIWSPPSNYDENEALLHHQKLAINWNEAQADEPICSSEMKALASKRDDQVRFNSAIQRLNTLLRLLEQRRNPYRTTILDVTITGNLFSLPVLSLEISSCFATLEVLDVSAIDDLNTTETELYFDHLLEKATHLHTFRLVNFRNAFKRYGILAALVYLSNLKILVLNETYLGEFGSKILEDILKKNALTELDLTNSGLVSDACFNHLKNGLRQCSSLQRLVLGQSPMTGAWLKMLIDAAERNPRLEIVWQPGNFKEMTKLFEGMCKAMQTAEPNLNTSAFLNNFMNQDLKELKTQTEALLASQQKSTNRSTSSRGGFFDRTGERGLETQPIKTATRGYGSTS